MAKAYVRNITRAQALSYERLTPNRLGVTAIAEVNGRGAYERRYRQTRQMLNNPDGDSMYTAGQKRALKKMSASRAKAFRAMLAHKPKTAARRNSSKKSAKRSPAKKRQPRVYGGRAALKARFGNTRTTRWTYMTRTKKGRAKHLPEWRILGFKSYKDRIKAGTTDKGARRLIAKREKIQARREKAAALESKRILAGKGIFTPNASDNILSYSAWSRRKKKMKPNATRKQIAAARRNIKKAQAAKRGTARRVVRRKRRTTKKSHSVGLRKVRRHVKLHRTAKVRRTRRNPARGGHHTAAARKKISRALRRHHCKRGAYKTRKATRKHSKRSYRRNPASLMAADYKDRLLGALKIGAIVLGGYVTHRALTQLLDEYGLSKIDSLSTGKVADWRKSIAGAVVAAVTIPASVYVLKNESAAVGSGIAVSFLHGLLMNALKAFNADAKVASYLGALPANYGSGARGGFGGLGGYFVTGPQRMQQAVGQYYAPGGGNPPWQLQPAGLGPRGPEFVSRLAGETPATMQAAVGKYYSSTGEYTIPNMMVQGGDYFRTSSAAPQKRLYDQGPPSLQAAERTLNYIDATAGVGDYARGEEAINNVPEGGGVDLPEGAGESVGGSFGPPGGIFADDNGIFSGQSF